MSTYCLSCKQDTKNIDSKVIKTKNNRKMMLSRCSICNNKKCTFTAESSCSERISQGSGIFDSLICNTRQNRMKDAYGMLLIDRITYTYIRSKELVPLALIKYE